MSERPANLIDHRPCRGCPQHIGDRSGCGVVEEGADVRLDEFLGRDPCFLKEQLARFATRYLAHRPRSLFDPDDLAQEVWSRLLSDRDVRSGGFGRGLAAFLAYLRQTAIRCAISAERRERGRVRCGNCKNFGSYSGICLKTAHTWTHRRVDSSQDPRGLEPPCREFVPRRDPQGLAPVADAASPGPERFAEDRASDVAEAVHQALVQLAESHPRAALVVRARLLDGKTYDDLHGIGASVRTMKRDFAHGVAFLRRKLAAFDAETMAHEPVGERSSRLENA